MRTIRRRTLHPVPRSPTFSLESLRGVSITMAACVRAYYRKDSTEANSAVAALYANHGLSAIFALCYLGTRTIMAAHPGHRVSVEYSPDEGDTAPEDAAFKKRADALNEFMHLVEATNETGAWRMFRTMETPDRLNLVSDAVTSVAIAIAAHSPPGYEGMPDVEGLL